MTTNQPLRHSFAASISLAAILFAPFLMVFCAAGLNAAAATNGKTTPVIHWPTPPVIRYGAALNANILNAWVSGAVPGSFVYSPAAGTVLGAGTQTLSVTFNPADTANYTSASTTVQLTVIKAVLTVGVLNKALTYGSPIPAFGISIKNFVNGDTIGVVSGTPVVTTTAAQGSPVGQYPITPSIGTLAAANYSFTFVPGTLTITPAPLLVHASNDGPLPFGVQIPPLKYSITGFRNGETQSIVVGAPIVTTTAVLGSAPGQYSITTTIGTLSAPNYTFQLFSATLTIVKATPKITWPTPAAITYGNALSATQLNATQRLPGTFVYTPPAGTLPALGTDTLSVTFTPIDTTDYAPATATVQLTVNKATPVIAWPTPAAVADGTALSSTQLDATANVAGTFVYTPAAGTIPAVGTDTLSVTFAPTDTTDYTTAAATVQLTVNKPLPVITWPTPASINYGTALSSTQLDATANMPGSFVYSPPAGTVVSGSFFWGLYSLSATFTPANPAYGIVTTTVTLVVNRVAPAAIVLKSSASTASFGAPITFTATLTGVSGGAAPTGGVTFLAGTTAIGQAALSGGVATGTIDMPMAGSRPITASYGSDNNYLPATSGAVEVTVSKGTPTISSLKSSTTHSVVGATVVFSTTVAGGGAAPTGNVTFFDGTTILGTATLSGGVATDLVKLLALGAHSITAGYSGDKNYTAVTSTALTETTATVSDTTTSLVVSSAGKAAATVDSGGVVTLTATVKAGSTPVTPGLVNFCDASAKYCTGAHLLGSAQLTANGTAAIKVMPAVGNHSYYAVFAGTLSGAASTSETASIDVTGLYRTATTIERVAGGGGVYVLAATVGSNGNTVPTGKVSFLDTSNGNAVVGTATLGNGAAGLALLNSMDPTVGWVSCEPLSTVTADFNGDGLSDFAMSSCYGVVVFLSNGDGTFTAAPTLDAFGDGWGFGESFAIVQVGDFNGDDIPDLAVINNPDVDIFLGNGDGTFKAGTVLRAFGADGLVVGDFNGDGVLDLAEYNVESPQAGVFLGVGDGTFAAPVAGSFKGSSVVSGDFNGDGIADLAVSTSTTLITTAGLNVYLSNGDGTFTATPQTLAGLGGQVLAAEFNGDGILDLATTGNSQSGAFTTFLGNGDGTFVAAPIPPEAPWNNSIAVGDFNGDGIPDIIGSNNQLYLGNGYGTFTVSAASMPPKLASFVATGDFTGQGIPDVVTADNQHTASVVLAESQTATATTKTVRVPGTGLHWLVASYSGDSNYKPSVSQPMFVDIGSGAALPAGLPDKR